jgi:hypothetical protein
MYGKLASRRCSATDGVRPAVVALPRTSESKRARRHLAGAGGPANGSHTGGLACAAGPAGM